LNPKTGCQKKQLKLHVDQNIRDKSYSAPHAPTSRHLVIELNKSSSGTARRNSSGLMTVPDDSADSLRLAARDESFRGHSQKIFQRNLSSKVAF
jgi:hypothetical protein